ncbi:hypothetical protein A2U01_0080529, partial [Trifolium medium]|nr:hypothetical protein [Trifolium medium]
PSSTFIPTNTSNTIATMVQDHAEGLSFVAFVMNAATGSCDECCYWFE